MELFLMPIKQRMEKALRESMIRLLTTPLSGMIEWSRPQEARALQWKSPLQRLQLRYHKEKRYPKEVPLLESKVPYAAPP